MPPPHPTGDCSKRRKSSKMSANSKQQSGTSSVPPVPKLDPSSVILYEMEENEDLDADLDLNDPSINECTHLTSDNPTSTTNPTTVISSSSQQSTNRPKSSSPNQRSPSRNLMLAIGGMLSGSSSKAQPTGSPKESTDFNPISHCSSTLSSSTGGSPFQCASSDEIQILISQDTSKPSKHHHPKTATNPTTKSSSICNSSKKAYHRQSSSSDSSSSYSDSGDTSTSGSNSSIASSPLTSLTLSTNSSTNNFATDHLHRGMNTLPHANVASASRSSAATVASGAVVITNPVSRSNSIATSTVPKEGGGRVSHAIVTTQDTLLLPASMQRSYQRYYDRRGHAYYSSSHSHQQQHNQQSRPSRLASCISVQSVASIASTDSSLSDYPPNTPICKFCHQRARANDPLISPCHCKGTIRYMHCRCLMKWLDKLKKRNSRHQPLACEICNYEYRWRKKLKPHSEWQLPPCIGNDRRWHTLFVVCAIVMFISMCNLIVFGEEDHHHSHPRGGGGGAHTVTFKTATTTTATNAAAADRASGAPPGAEIEQQQLHNNPAISAISIKDLFGNDTRDPGAPGLFFFNPNLINLNNQSLAGNLTELLRNFSAAFPALRNMLPSPPPPPQQPHPPPIRNKNTTNSQPKYATDFVESSLMDKFGLPPPPQPKGSTQPKSPLQPPPESASDHFLYHPRATNPRAHHARTKNTPTKPSEIILVVSGCLFFISFFLGTFAQIKSEVSFYTLCIRFLHWNQQWIIEEYDPDGGLTSGENGGGGATSPLPIQDGGLESGGGGGESNEASTSSITKAHEGLPPEELLGSSGMIQNYGVQRRSSNCSQSSNNNNNHHQHAICVQIEPNSCATTSSELFRPGTPGSLLGFPGRPGTPGSSSMIITSPSTPINQAHQVIDL